MRPSLSDKHYVVPGVKWIRSSLWKLCRFNKILKKLRRLVQRFDLYLAVSGKIKEYEKVHCAVPLHVIGEEALEIYNTFKFATGEDPNKISVLKKRFVDYVNPRKNTAFERYRFWESARRRDHLPISMTS